MRLRGENERAYVGGGQHLGRAALTCEPRWLTENPSPEGRGLFAPAADSCPSQCHHPALDNPTIRRGCGPTPIGKLLAWLPGQAAEGERNPRG